MMEINPLSVIIAGAIAWGSIVFCLVVIKFDLERLKKEVLPRGNKAKKRGPRPVATPLRDRQTATEWATVEEARPIPQFHDPLEEGPRHDPPTYGYENELARMDEPERAEEPEEAEGEGHGTN